MSTASRIACRSTAERSRSEEHTSELQSQFHLVCRLLLGKENGYQLWAVAKLFNQGRPFGHQPTPHSYQADRCLRTNTIEKHSRHRGLSKLLFLRTERGAM